MSWALRGRGSLFARFGGYSPMSSGFFGVGKSVEFGAIYNLLQRQNKPKMLFGVKSNKRLSTLPQLAHPLNLIGLNNPNQTVFYSYLKVKKWRNLWSPYHLNLRTKCVLKLAKKFWHNVSLPAKSDSGAAHVQVETISQRFTQLPHDKSRKNHWGSFAVELDFLKVHVNKRQ